MKTITTCIVLLLLTLVSQAETIRHEGILKGAPYTVVTPQSWEGGKVFFHVHGWRPEDAPHEADLNMEDPFYEGLVNDGWIIGRTAFQENGVDHDAHTLALRDLKEWIEDQFGPIKTLVLEGESTAGTLVLRIAEQDADLADGVIAKGPFIEFFDTELDSYLTAKPQIPSILMSNTTEIIHALEYSVLSESGEFPASLRPLMRPGHVNVNWVERRAALMALLSTIDGESTKILTNGTREVPARVTGTTEEEGYLVNEVISVNPYYGNAFLGYHPDELIDAGIVKGEAFEVEAGGKTWSVVFGSSYGDVPAGEWVAFPTADATIMLVRNHQSAIETAGITVGDPIRIKALQE